MNTASNNPPYNLLIIGGGASGLVAAIAARRLGKTCIICEHMSNPGRKLLATGGKRCNISNTLPEEEFMKRFGRYGRFMEPALREMNSQKLQKFFKELGLETAIKDGFRIWPKDHNSKSVYNALVNETERLGVKIESNCRVKNLEQKEGIFKATCSNNSSYLATKVIIATGGLSYPSLGATGDGYQLASSLGHKITPCYPAGVALNTVEKWPSLLTAHTIGKANLKIQIKKTKITANGDLIFTKEGIAGPLILDVSREITPLIEKHSEVPIYLNLTKNKNQEDWQKKFNTWKKNSFSQRTVIDLLAQEVPRELGKVFCELTSIDPNQEFSRLSGANKERLAAILVKTPLTINGTPGYKSAFITRGGVSLREIDPKTLESKITKNLYFCGEVVDLDGPCGGFNLQWAFASGFLAGNS